MEGIFNSRELYEYLEEQKQSNISRTKEISLYYKATSKNIEDDEYSLRIWLDYIWLLMDGVKDMTEARETFKMIKMRFCKFYEYWRAYIGFEIAAKNGNLCKVLQQSIDLVKVKEFGEKRGVLEYLEHVLSCVNGGSDLSVFAAGSSGRRMETLGSDAKKERDQCDARKGRVCGSGDGIGFITTPSSLGHMVENRRDEKVETWGVGGIPYGSPVNGIPIQLEKENYTQGITAEINAALGKRRGECGGVAELQPRERITINDKEVEVLKQIGKGGSSKVYKVLLGNNIYALKKVELVGDEKMLGSYMNEISLLYKFKGASEIVEIIDHEIRTDYLYILLEYGETDLARMIKNGGLSMNFVRDVWEQMLLIVRRVHGERIIHCDLKPANFLFVRGRVKLIDFGISKVIRNDTTSILSEEQCGTVNYMSPEAVTQNKSKVARSSDIWSLGCILYEMVHSRPPLYEYPNLIQKIQRLQEYSEFKYTSKHRCAVMVMKECLAKDPKKRPTIDRLLNHRFLKGDVEPECLEMLVERVLGTSSGTDMSSCVLEAIDQFYRS